jgi:RNA polymerase sigma factor (TIGR02999 family)
MAMGDITTILQRVKDGKAEASEELLPLVYQELKRIASSRMAKEKPGQTLQGTALVHEAWIKLVESQAGTAWNDRQTFFAAASEAMRRILVDIARRKNTVKHGGEQTRRPLCEVDVAIVGTAEEVVAVNDALSRLQGVDGQAAELVRLHYFGGLSLEETAELLGISRATAYRTWTFARTFLLAVVFGR